MSRIEMLIFVWNFGLEQLRSEGNLDRIVRVYLFNEILGGNLNEYPFQMLEN